MGALAASGALMMLVLLELLAFALPAGLLAAFTDAVLAIEEEDGGRGGSGGENEAKEEAFPKRA